MCPRFAFMFFRFGQKLKTKQAFENDEVINRPIRTRLPNKCSWEHASCMLRASWTQEAVNLGAKQAKLNTARPSTISDNANTHIHMRSLSLSRTQTDTHRTPGYGTHLEQTGLGFNFLSAFSSCMSGSRAVCVKHMNRWACKLNSSTVQKHISSSWVKKN